VVLGTKITGADLSWSQYALWILVGFAAIAGHLFSCFLKFKGGKGVATSCGVMMGLFPYLTIPGVLGTLVWIVVFQIWRYVSLASIAGAVAFPVLYVVIALAMGWPVFGQQWPLLVFALVIAGMIVIKHRSNIARLRAGTENRFARKPRVDKPV
jgi:acyl phosphate:glycerol-3-phosphate acyltransferase